MMTISVLI